jgi:hypothetical protein
LNDDDLITTGDLLSDGDARALYEKLQAVADDRANGSSTGCGAGSVRRRVRQLRRQPRSSLAIVLAIAVFTAPFVGLAATRLPGNGSPGHPEPVVPKGVLSRLPLGSVVDNDGKTIVHGGTAAQRSLMAKVLAGIDGRLVPAVRILQNASPLPASNHAPRVRLAFAFPRSAGVASQLAAWEARLVAGAFRDESRRLGLPKVIEATMAYPDYGPISLHLFGPQVANPIPGDATHLTAQIERSLRRMHLHPITILFARPSGLAPIVIAETNDPSAALAHWRPDGWPVDDSKYEGLFFEVVNSERRPVFFYAHTTRVPGGTGTGGDILPHE